ncbi:MAG: hypothetical protein ACLU4N_08815 [Butyricimonas faecihominis]
MRIGFFLEISGRAYGILLPELAEIAEHNHAIFKELQKISNIDYKTTRYINLAHDDPRSMP